MKKQDRESVVYAIIEAIEDIIQDQTGQYVLRSGWDGTLTNDGGTVARMIDEALRREGE